MGQGLSFDQIRDISRFRLGLPQKFGADRDIVEKVSDHHAGAIRRADLLEVQLYRRILAEACQDLVGGAYPRQ